MIKDQKTKTAKPAKPKAPKLTPEEIEAQELRLSDDVRGEVV